ncbi:MAG: hypothetical protein ACK58L_11105 [Planctomycetota bacterium]
MVRHESDREDLIREAVALHERVELQVSGFDDPVTIGYRSNRAMSIFFGQDPVYQFDPQGCLRRAFVDGLLYRSQHGTLARLRRQRTDSKTLLLRDDLKPDELECFKARMRQSLETLRSSITSGKAVVSRSVPESHNLLPEVANSLHLALNTVPWLSAEIRRRV